MKNFFVKTLIFLVFLVLFDTLFLVYEDTANCPGSVWAAFAGANIGYLMFLPTALLAPGARGTRVMAGTLYLIWARYFIAELIVAVTFVFWVQESTLWPVLAQSVLLAVFLVALLMSYLANNATEQSIGRQDADADLLGGWAMSVEASLAAGKWSQEARAALRRTLDEVRACSTATTPQSRGVDMEISTAIAALEQYSATGDEAMVMQSAAHIKLLMGKRQTILQNRRHY